MNKSIIQIEAEITAIIKGTPNLADRIEALEVAGYKDIGYFYVKNKCM